MARPIKQGLDYYPLDVGFLQDVKIRRIMRACGIQSIPVLISLLANIYRNDGYFLRWSPDMSFLIADELGVSEGAVTATVDKAVQVDFFNANMYECYGVLTSEGIQSRFFEAASRRREVRYDARFLLINVNVYKNLVNVDNNPVNVDDNPQSKVKESKVKESKVKESKVKESKEEGEERTSAAADEIMGYYSSNIHPVSSLVEKDKLIALVETHGDAFVHKAIERAVVRNKRSLAYITGILNRWEANGYDEGISENHKSSRNQWQHSEDYERFMREREEHKRKLRQRGS